MDDTININISAEQFQKKVLCWFDDYGRKDLPWQNPKLPYQVWLSEVMLQQTQVTTVIPYFNRFIQQFPDVEALAGASLDAVLHLWSGLGYYARARNLHKTARIISCQGGVFPEQLDALIALPGIGRSTAGAILSIAFNQSQPILDGNVRRVLARHYVVSGWFGHSRTSKQLWQISTQNTPQQRAADYTQAMMDLGATICTRSQPKCEQCPIEQSCLANMRDQIKLFPTPKPKKSIPVKQLIFLMLEDRQGRFLLEKRPPSGIWGGLWSFLEFDSIENMIAWCVERKLVLQLSSELDEQRHTFSHYHLDYTTVLAKTDKSFDFIMDTDRLVWYKTEQIKLLGLPAPITKLFKEQHKQWQE